MSATSMTDEDLLLSLLNKIAVEQKLENYDIKITPVSSGGANYTSKLYSVQITSKSKDDLKLFAKIAILGEKVREQTQFDPFIHERIIYTKLLVTYRQIEEKHGIPEEHRLRFSKYYGADMTRLQEVLVLEDLTSRGFQAANRFLSVDWSYAAAAITELAKLHALSMVYEQERPTDYNDIVKSFPTGIFKENEMFDGLFAPSVQTALTAVREENKEKFETFFEGKNVGTYYSNVIEATRRKVLIHMDYRPSNMLHKLKEDGTTEVIPVDYQTVQIGSPIFDLLYFIFTATDQKFRKQHYQDVLDHYHSELGAALARLGLDVEHEFSKEDFENELKEKLPAGLMMSVMLLPVLTVPEDQAPNMNDSLEGFDAALGCVTDLYRERMNGVVDDYVEWGIL